MIVLFSERSCYIQVDCITNRWRYFRVVALTYLAAMGAAKSDELNICRTDLLVEIFS